jgi:hypothetical protein
MSKFLRVSAVSVFCVSGAIAVSQAQSVTCENAQYDPGLLAKYPNLPKSCLDIITKDGELYAVVKAKLDKVSGNSVRVRIKQPDGTYADRTTVRTDSNLRVKVDGRPTRVSDLATGQELSAYIKVREPAIALAPAEESAPLVTSPIEDEPEQMAATLPSTSSFLPLLGLFGGASLLLGVLLSVVRHRRP